MKRMYITSLLSLAAMVALAPEGSGGSPTFADNLREAAEASAKQGSPKLDSTTIATTASAAVGLGLTGTVAFVSKQGEEGLLAIDGYTGQVIPSANLPNGEERPQWALDLGLVMAMLSERHIFYTAKLGPEAYSQEHRQPEVYAFEDIEWLALNMETTEETVIAADDEHRMEVIAQVFGINREDGSVQGSASELELSWDNTRTGDEMKAFTDAQQQGFGEAQKTGTQG